MKKLTFEEFSARTQEVLKAERIFGTLTDGNISTAFKVYQEILAEEKMDVFISTALGGNRTMTPLDIYERPKCPECDTDLRLMLDVKDSDGRQWKSSWACPECQAEFYSDKTAEDWMKELEKKDVQK